MLSPSQWISISSRSQNPMIYTGLIIRPVDYGMADAARHHFKEWPYDKLF